MRNLGNVQYLDCHIRRTAAVARDVVSSIRTSIMSTLIFMFCGGCTCVLIMKTINCLDVDVLWWMHMYIDNKNS
jgi:hypothetical protein